MGVIRFNFTTDHHFSHRPPGRRQGDYFADLSSKMEQVASHCNATKSVPLFGGDLFHLKDPNKIAAPNLIRFLGDMSNLLSCFECKPKCAIGNHDIRFDRLSTLPEQPLGLMAAAGKVDLLCPYEPTNLVDWEAPSGHTYLVPRVLPAQLFPTYEDSFVMVYSTPYIDDPQDLVAYLASETFHGSLEKYVTSVFSGPAFNSEGISSITGILLLHTLAGPVQTEFFGLQRAAYSQIHAALSLSDLGRATSAVLFGHEHPDGGSYVLPLEKSPPPVKNMPRGLTLATGGTIFINPASFSRSSLDYTDGETEAERPVYMVDLTYTPSGLGLAVNAGMLPLVTRPISQLFAAPAVETDPLNQGGVDVVVVDPIQQWTSFSDALQQLDKTGENPEQFLVGRLKDEPPEVISTVKTLLEATNA